MYLVHVVPAQDWPEAGMVLENNENIVHCSCIEAIITISKTDVLYIKLMPRRIQFATFCTVFLSCWSSVVKIFTVLRKVWSIMGYVTGMNKHLETTLDF